MPARSRKVGAKSMTVENERLKEPGVLTEDMNVFLGGFMTQGTRMPPSDG